MKINPYVLVFVFTLVTAGLIIITNNQFLLQRPQQAIAQGQQEQPAVGKKIVTSTVSSDVDPLKGHEGHQAAVILPPRNDSAVYSGTLTFTVANQYRWQ